MDWLDRISIWAIVILIISSFALISSHMGEARSERHLQPRAAVPAGAVTDAKMDAMVKLARGLMEADNVGKAETVANELIREYPYQAAPHMLMADILLRKQDPVKAVLQYKEAIDINADYLDRKTPLFQGKKIRAAVGEALAEIDKKLKFKPADASLKSERKAIYYLQRRIAGSCS